MKLMTFNMSNIELHWYDLDYFNNFMIHFGIWWQTFVYFFQVSKRSKFNAQKKLSKWQSTRVSIMWTISKIHFSTLNRKHYISKELGFSKCNILPKKSPTGIIFYVKHQTSKSNVLISGICTTNLQNNNFLSQKL